MIGIVGWSQGGWVGPLAASRSDAVAYVVSLSGATVPPLEQNIYDKTNQLRATGADEARVARFSDVLRSVWTYIATGEGRVAAQSAWDGVVDEPWFEEHYEGPPMMDRDRLLAHPRMAFYVEHQTYDPLPALESLRIPMLAVFGEADRVVPVEASIEALRGAFARSGNTRLEIRMVPGADHGLRVAESDGTRHLAEGYPAGVFEWIREVLAGTSG